MSSLLQRTIKNSIYSFIGFIWPMVLSFVAMPLLINRLGVQKYGFYVLLNASLTFFSLLDFGFNYTFVKKLSENPSSENHDELSKIFSSTFILYVFVGLLACLLLILLPDFFREVFKIPDGFLSSYRLGFAFLGVAFFFKMIVIPLAQIPYALQRSDIVTKITLINITVLQLASIAAVYNGKGIMALLILQLISAMFVFGAYFFYRMRLIPNLNLQPYFAFNTFRGLMKDGFWMVIINVMSSILTQLDKFILSVFWGPTVVSYYSSAQMIPEKIQATSFSLSQVLFPVFSNVSYLNDLEKVRRIFRRSIKYIILIASSLATLVLIYGYSLLKYWLGVEFANNAAASSYVLAITYFFFSIGVLISFYLSGTRRLKVYAAFITIMALLDTIFVFMLMPQYKIMGASIAYAIGVILPTICALLWVEMKYLKESLANIILFYFGIGLRIVMVSVLVYLFSRQLLLTLINNLAITLFFGLLSWVVFFSLCKLVGYFDKEDMDIIRDTINKLFLKYKKS